MKRKNKDGWVEAILVDHRKADNPYESLYGANWLAKMKAGSSFSKIVDIRDLVDHMYEKSRDAFTVDGVTDESFRIYHDTLSQLTDSACQ